MICVSIADCTATECLKALAGCKAAEIRLETISKIDETAVKWIFGSKAKIVATCRPGKMPDEKRKKLLLAAIAAGAAYVDVEVDAPDEYKQEIVKAANAKGCEVIVSFHDHEKTPVREELEQTIDWCFNSGADIAKIACKVNSKADAARLLGLLDDERELIVVGMGDEGKIVRIAAPLLGSRIAYVSQGKGKETAGGQMTADELERKMKEISND
jgi:3-dehydroquinate dehydratase I